MNTDNLQTLFKRIHPQIAANVKELTGDMPRFILFVSFTDTLKRAHTLTVSAASFKDCWNAGVEKTCQSVTKLGMAVRWLRVDWVESVEAVTWQELSRQLEAVKRNYFRFGLALDRGFKTAFLETEINANAMLYGGPSINHAMLNHANFSRYAGLRHGVTDLGFADDSVLYKFSTRAAFTAAGSEDVFAIAGAGRNAGRRVIEQLEPTQLCNIVSDSSLFLASQVNDNGRFIYGWHPCFDRQIKTYNSLRHASTLYSMIEAWEVTGDQTLQAAIDRSLAYLTNTLIKTVRHQNADLAFLVDEPDEIKLGGNAVCLLALVKYCEVTKSEHYLNLLEKLACGILFMQDQDSGQFSHVLHASTLEVKEPFRIIYYDGEAAFGLMRLYSLTGDARWLSAVEKAFTYFIEAKHWRANDHWLSYAVNELTRYRPCREYYEFGLKNFDSHLDFVIERITTFPTLLELMMAAEQMVTRVQQEPDLAPLLAKLDLKKFYRALETRAHYLLNGHFWPELAMFYANPKRITGSFFIRHHAFRVRIDDVEHYLSGLIAYMKYKEKAAAFDRIGNQPLAAE